MILERAINSGIKKTITILHDRDNDDLPFYLMMTYHSTQ
jgi:hypothetical protein